MADAAVDAAAPDAPIVVRRCDPSKPFGTPAPVPNVNSPQRDQGAVLVDELTLVFGSDRSPAGIYTATRSSPDAAFARPMPVTALAAASGPSLTADGKTMYYTLSAIAAPKAEIYVTARDRKDVDFLAGTAVARINSSEDDLDPNITPDGSALYFDSARVGVALHLYVAIRQSDGSFGDPQPLTDLNSSAIDSHPVLSNDGLTLYWSSTRSDGGAQGGTDIWTATRPSTAAAFRAPARVVELSSAKNEALSWISPDNCAVYLQSDRIGTMGAQDIFEAVRPM